MRPKYSHHLRFRRALAASGIAVVVVALALPRAARAAIALEVVPNTGLPGDTIVATASGIVPPPGEVTFWWDGATLLGVDPSIESGQASLSFKIPSTPLGPHFVR